MRIFAACLTLLMTTGLYAQKSEELVPKQAMSVFSLNNINLLQRISLDELVKYEFMEELQQELFDGSTSGKTLKESGIDFDQKLNIFFGKGSNFEIGGVTFGVKDRALLFEVFDDFQAIESNYPGVDFYASYFNTIAIKGNAAVLFRVSPNMELVNAISDSIWYARGNKWPWDGEIEHSMEEMLRELEQEENGTNDELRWENESEEGIEFFDEMETEENTSTPIEGAELPVAGDDPNHKTYYELIDSVQVAMQQEYLVLVCEDLFVRGDNLMAQAPEFKEQLTHATEGVFYSDNSRNLQKNFGFNYMRSLYPGFYGDLEELYQGNVLLGDLVIQDNAIELQMDAKYGPRLGLVYEAMTQAKFDKNILKYIHKDHNAFLTFRVNTLEAYEKFYTIFHPMLAKEAENNRLFSERLLVLELWDELINKDALFKAYPGGAFVTYNGISKVKTRKYVFEYDEETFEYTEKEVEAEEDMPLFTFGISTQNPSIATKVLNHLERSESDCRKDGDVWVFEKAILNSAPLYVFIRNGLILYTNDEKLGRNNLDGYGENALGKTLASEAQKSGFIYGYADLGKAIEGIPRSLFSEDENVMLDVVRGKSGRVALTSTSTSTSQTRFNLRYTYEEESETSGTYILDLINSLYVLSK